ncbi:type 1 glutamine amidotransferase [Hyphomicrobium sp. B1]|uniref:type 1 glutamine amidotransferase n=1 Tax=Hyphomicrobium sp. B1 TaxID=3075651 RepID=UPI003C2F683B
MRVTVIQNSAYGSAGLVEKFIASKGWTCRRTLSPKDIVTTDLADIADDVVVFLGSRRGVYETHIQWIARERALMKRLIDNAIPVLGICFGAQLLATALGGTVKPIGHRYRGWMENAFASTPVWQGPWLRWHGDFITLPGEIKVLARDNETVQAFEYGNAVGVQFHPEVSNAVLKDWGAYRRSMPEEDQISLAKALNYADDHAYEIEKRAFELFDNIFGKIVGRSLA